MSCPMMELGFVFVFVPNVARIFADISATISSWVCVSRPEVVN